MKRLIFIYIIMFFVAISSQAQPQRKDIILKNNTSSGMGGDGTTHEYIYEVYGSIPTPKAVFEEEHYLGGVISSKWNVFNQIYTQVFDVKAGLSSSAVEIHKPSVYNAVIKVNNYFKKAIKKGLVSKDEACRRLSHIFDCANVICYHDNTSDFENAVKRAKSTDDIINLFDKVEIKVIN